MDKSRQKGGLADTQEQHAVKNESIALGLGRLIETAEKCCGCIGSLVRVGVGGDG